MIDLSKSIDPTVSAVNDLRRDLKTLNLSIKDTDEKIEALDRKYAEIVGLLKTIQETIQGTGNMQSSGGSSPENELVKIRNDRISRYCK